MYGNNIKALRKKFNLSQEEFGASLGLSKQAISAYEKEERRPNLEVLNLIYKRYRVSPNEIIGATRDDDVLNGDEKAVLELFRQATPYQQEMILRMLDAAVSPKESN
jgi:transcriptional regulator with XRE-family HTH domain